MRLAACTALFCVVLCGCGYVGPVVPPSPEIPAQILDLRVVEDGADLVFTFTTPARTLDNHAIRKFSVIDLRIGPDMQPMDMNRWADSAKEIDIPVPPPNQAYVARPTAIKYTLPAAEWSGQHIAVAVRTAVKNDKDYSNWSRVERLEVIAPLAAPKLNVFATAQGYKLTWNDVGPGISYRVFRQGQGTPDQPAVLIGTSNRPEYIDTSSQFSTPYIYSVVAAKGAAESPVSNKVAINEADTFPPAAPTGLTGLATGDSIELSWQRSPEADLQGYYVYRSANGGPLERQGGMIRLPAFTDRGVQHGTTYRYQVSAVDKTANEGDKSPAVEVRFP